MDAAMPGDVGRTCAAQFAYKSINEVAKPSAAILSRSAVTHNFAWKGRTGHSALLRTTYDVSWVGLFTHQGKVRNEGPLTLLAGLLKTRREPVGHRESSDTPRLNAF
jgi:hypothetical protein